METGEVRLWLKADMQSPETEVWFTSNTGHSIFDVVRKRPWQKGVNPERLRIPIAHIVCLAPLLVGREQPFTFPPHLPHSATPLGRSRRTASPECQVSPRRSEGVLKARHR